MGLLKFVPLGILLVAVIGVLLRRREARRVETREKEDRLDRREDAKVDEYVRLVQNHLDSGWHALATLGLVELKEDSRIRRALQRMADRVGKHPMGREKNMVEGIDLSIFFSYVASNGINFQQTSVQDVLDGITGAEDE